MLTFLDTTDQSLFRLVNYVGCTVIIETLERGAYSSLSNFICFGRCPWVYHVQLYHVEKGKSRVSNFDQRVLRNSGKDFQDSRLKISSTPFSATGHWPLCIWPRGEDCPCRYVHQWGRSSHCFPRQRTVYQLRNGSKTELPIVIFCSILIIYLT